MCHEMEQAHISVPLSFSLILFLILALNLISQVLTRLKGALSRLHVICRKNIGLMNQMSH